MLSRRGFTVNDDAIREGLASLTIPAKFEVVSLLPTIIVDSTHTPVATDTVCQALTDFHSLDGAKIRLCLPDEKNVQNYVTALKKYGYSIEKLIVPDGVEFSDKEYAVCYGKSKKSMIKLMLEDLGTDTPLLISGDYAFVNPLRYELLATLGY